MLKTAAQHPHHCGWVLIALANSNTGAASGPKATAALQVLHQLKNTPGLSSIMDLPALVAGMETLSAHYTQLAEKPVTKSQLPIDTRNSFELARVHATRGSLRTALPRSWYFFLWLTFDLRTVLEIAVLTADQPVDSTGRYDHGVVGIARFGDTYSLAGGIHCPKILICYGTDGLEYKQLVKVG
jgi:hypothetical protein